MTPSPYDLSCLVGQAITSVLNYYHRVFGSIIALYFESENVLRFYNLEANHISEQRRLSESTHMRRLSKAFKSRIHNVWIYM